MTILFLITSIFFFLGAVRTIFFWTNLWQIKEYRIDRFFIHFTETNKGREILFSPFSWLKWFVLVLYVIPIFYDATLSFYHTIVFLLLSIEGILVTREVIFRKIRKPVFTLRAVLILFGTFLLLFFLYLFPLVDKYVWLLLLLRGIPLIVFFFVFLLAIPSDLVKDFLIEKASKKIQQHKKLLVIGVSGSYGKSSTKEYIAHILSSKFKVAKTEGSHNTPIGVAQAVLSKIHENTEIFVVELGSYKKGEVTELCEIVHPKISITTSISDQHLSLYGSLQNIIKTENELIDSLPKDGIALFNGNDNGAYDLYKKTKRKKVLYKSISSNKSKGLQSEIIAKNIIINKDGVSFYIEIDKKNVLFECFVLGEHTVENILPGIYLGLNLGMNVSQVKEAVKSLVPLSKTMIKHTFASGATFIDDTFNASPESVKAALDYMKIYSNKKVLILEPLIELGENAHIDHYKLGKEIGKVCDYLFLTNSNFYSSILSGVTETGNCRIKIASSKEIVQFIQSSVKKNDIVVFEGREPGFVLTKLLQSHR